MSSPEEAGEPSNPHRSLLPPVDFGGATTSELDSRTLHVELERLTRDRMTRNALAMALARLLAILTVLTLCAAIAGVNPNRLTLAAQLTITPVLALCGTAFGFYFGQQAARDDKR